MRHQESRKLAAEEELRAALKVNEEMTLRLRDDAARTTDARKLATEVHSFSHLFAVRRALADASLECGAFLLRCPHRPRMLLTRVGTSGGGACQALSKRKDGAW